MASKAAATTAAHEVHASAAAHAAHSGLRVGEVVEGGLVPLEMLARP
jgi:hypothetical protein